MVVTPNAAAARIDHTYLKRGVYYFNRRVPLDVSRHYKSRRINFSLRTKSGVSSMTETIHRSDTESRWTSMFSV